MRSNRNRTLASGVINAVLSPVGLSVEVEESTDEVVTRTFVDHNGVVHTVYETRALVTGYEKQGRYV
jgi:hypothetical protein